MPQPRTSPTAHACPFVAGPMITNPSLFVGRKDALRTITSRMIGPQPTSINVVGKKRIGKSSLLYHFFQTWEQRVPDPNCYVVIYLSLQDADCRTEADFYKAVAQELLQRPTVRNNSALATPLNEIPLNRQTFSTAIETWQAANVLPVLCLDKFEALLDKPQDFPNDFYDNLRSLMNKNALMLVIASTEPVQEYAKKKRLVSDFFNLGQCEVLTEFTEEEVNELVSLSTHTMQDTTPVLAASEQKKAREWGEKHPYLLQLASLYLWEARQPGKDEVWAKRRFDEQASNVPQPWFNRKKLSRVCYLIFIGPFVYVTKLVKGTGGTFSIFMEWLQGVAIVGLFILALSGMISWSDIIEWFKALLGVSE